MKYILLLLLFISTLFAQHLKHPSYTYKVSSGSVTDIVYDNFTLYAATDAGKILIFNTKDKKTPQNITLHKIKDFMGDEVNSKIFCIDILHNTLLILSQDNGGYNEIYLWKNNKLLKIISSSNKLHIVKAKFIDDNTILFALISNDIISYNIKTKKRNWTKQASMSKFSSFSLNNQKDKVAIVDESGNVHIINTKNGKILRTLSGQNVDNIFSVAFRNNVILTGGQDRRAAVYNLKSNEAYHQTSHFFIYAVGLSPSGKIAAYSSDLHNHITLFNTTTRENIAKYTSDKAIINGIYFIDENSFFVYNNSSKIDYYKLK
ncbi:WD40 repeat domain-containing protein [Sulfurimonas sp.]